MCLQLLCIDNKDIVTLILASNVRQIEAVLAVLKAACSRN
jgi:hypothetical protein